jgi:signal transduction histidine kinase
MSVRTRYTILYGVLFLISGAGLLGLFFAISARQGAAGPVLGSPNGNRGLFWGAVVALAVMGLVSIVLGRAVAGRVLRPLRTITAATRRITADNLHQRLAVRGPADEVRALADTIDDLLERLEQAFAAQRRFVANASHELRTPLATMRAALDVAMAKPDPVPPVLAARLRTELDRVDHLLDGLLTLARAQHGALADRVPVLLGDLATAALRAAPTDGLQVYAETAAAGPVTGNEVLLARMVANVIDNAVVHNVPGGWLRVVATGPQLVVTNGGPVLDPAALARLGRPFERLGADRTGTGSGLGLSIVHAIAAAHGGSVCLTPVATGGLQVEITLPSADCPSSPVCSSASGRPSYSEPSAAS